MENRIESLKDLLTDEARELYQSTQKELNALPKMEAKVRTPELKKIIQKQRETSQNEQQKIKNAFNTLKADLGEGKSETVEALFKRFDQVIEKSADNEVRDVAVINSMQQLCHRKIAGYGTAAALAEEIGHQDVAKTFRAALDEQKKMDAELTQIAKQEVNSRAAKVTA